MYYEPYHHEEGIRSPLEQHLYSSAYMTGKIDQGPVNSMADNWQADCHCYHPSEPKPKPQRSSSPVVRFHEESSVYEYEADEDEQDDYYSRFSPSRSEEVSFKTTTNRTIMACRQELLDASGDSYALSNGLQRRGGRIKEVSTCQHT